MPTLTIYQPYFEQEQLANINYIPYDNKDCSPYFENKVIVDLINEKAHKGSDYFGVLSHKFKQKITERKSPDWDQLANFKNHSRVVMDAEGIEYALSLFSPAILALMQHPPHDPITYGGKFHKDLPALFKYITAQIGCEWFPEIFERVYYSNYFIAKSKLYEDYVKTMLEPAIKVMDTMPDLWRDSGYAFPLPENLKQKWNVDFYPYHPFVLERLFSYYCHINQNKIWKKQK